MNERLSPSHASDTSRYVARAVEGDPRAIEWTVSRFTPFLVEAARRRLGRSLQGLLDADDLVHEVWAISLPRLGRLRPRDHRFTPVLVKYLGTVLMRRYHDLLRKHIRGKPLEVARAGDSSGDQSPVEAIPAATADLMRRAMRAETAERIRECLQKLSEDDRAILLHRAVEGADYDYIARTLGLENAASNPLRVRYRRILAKLRSWLPDTVFDELSDG